MKKNILLVVLLISVVTLVSCTPTNSVSKESVQLPVGVEESTETDTVLEGANIVTLTDDDYHDVIDNSEGIVIVDFWAAWCGPCVALAPILEEVSAEEGVTVYKLNVDENPATAAEFNITGIPMVYIYKDGEIVATQLGLAPKATYAKHVNDHR